MSKDIGQLQLNGTDILPIGIESISGTNGTALKFPDGTLICYGRRVLETVAITNQWGSVFASNSVAGFTYPVPFTDIPVLTMSGNSQNMNFWIMEIGTGSNTETPVIQLLRGTSSTINNGTINYIAVGRWK